VARDSSLAVVQGTLDVLILKALSGAPQHGYGVAAWIHQQTEGELGIDDGALYQALHRLADRGWIDAEWGVSESNRRARFYRLTRIGRQELRIAEGTWRRYARAIARVLDAKA